MKVAVEDIGSFCPMQEKGYDMNYRILLKINVKG